MCVCVCVCVSVSVCVCVCVKYSQKMLLFGFEYRPLLSEETKQLFQP